MVKIAIKLITHPLHTFYKVASRVPCKGEYVEFDGDLEIYEVVRVVHALNPASIENPVAEILVSPAKLHI